MKRFFLAIFAVAAALTANARIPLTLLGNGGAAISGTTVSLVQDAYDPVTSTTSSGTSAVTYNHAQGNLTYGGVFVGVAWRGSNTITAITYGGTAMTLLVSYAPYNTSNSAIYWLPLGTSSSGSKTVSITFSGSTAVDFGAVTFSGVHQAGGFTTGSTHNSGTNNLGDVPGVATASTSNIVIGIGEADPQTGTAITPYGTVTNYWTETTLLTAGFGWAPGTGSTVSVAWNGPSVTYDTGAAVVITAGP